MTILLLSAILALQIINLIAIRKVVKYMKQVRVNEDTFDALLTLAEQAVAGQKAAQEHVAALESAVANEEDLSGDRKSRLDALVQPTDQTSQPADAQAPQPAQPEQPTAAPAEGTSSPS